MWQSFPNSSVGKESTCNAGDPGLIPGLGRSTGEGIVYPLQSSGLENSIDCIVHRVVKSQTRLNDFHFYFSWCSKVYHSWLQWGKRTKEKMLTTLGASSPTSPCSTLEPNDISHSTTMWVLWKDDFETFVPRAAIKRLPETHRNNKVIWTSEEAMAPKAKSTLCELKEAASTGIPQRDTTSSVPEHCNKVNTAIKQVTQFF